MAGFLHSGHFITANIAVQENRNVLAVPGSILQPLSQGCNELIGEGARPALTANDILEELRMRVLWWTFAKDKNLNQWFDSNPKMAY